MPTVSASRTIAASTEELWEVICDPHHLPRWWPRVTRVEDVDARAFTEVMRTGKGKVVRADFELVEADEARLTLRWAQAVQGTPFGRLLRSAETEVRLVAVGSGAGHARAAAQVAPAQDMTGAERPGAERLAGATVATEVTIELRQELNGLFARLGSFMVRKAASATIEAALDGLQRISGRA